MKNLLIFFLFFAIGCDSLTDSESIDGSGKTITINETFTDFSIIETGYAFEVNISKGPEYAVSIKVDDNVEKYLNVSQEGKTLKIFLQEGRTYSDVTLEANITLPDIEGLGFSGATNSLISGFELDHDLNIVLSGASRLSADINATNIVIIISGASSVNLSGVGTYMNANISGASSLQAGGFPVKNVDINLSGASTSAINLSGLLNAVVSGASKLFYYGNPTLGNISITGASIFQALD